MKNKDLVDNKECDCLCHRGWNPLGFHSTMECPCMDMKSKQTTDWKDDYLKIVPIFNNGETVKQQINFIENVIAQTKADTIQACLEALEKLKYDGQNVYLNEAISSSQEAIKKL